MSADAPSAAPVACGRAVSRSRRRSAPSTAGKHEAVLDRHRARMRGAGALMRRRAALAEHPFGTLKCRAGHRHFLVRGFDKVRGEWSLMALCYNLARMLKIVGLDSFIAYLAHTRA